MVQYMSVSDSDGKEGRRSSMRNAAFRVLSAVGTLLIIYQELVSFPRPRLKPELEEILRIPPAPYASSSALFLFDSLSCLSPSQYTTIPLCYSQPLARPAYARRTSRIWICVGKTYRHRGQWHRSWEEAENTYRTEVSYL